MAVDKWLQYMNEYLMDGTLLDNLHMRLCGIYEQENHYLLGKDFISNLYIVRP